METTRENLNEHNRASPFPLKSFLHGEHKVLCLKYYVPSNWNVASETVTDHFLNDQALQNEKQKKHRELLSKLAWSVPNRGRQLSKGV